MIPLYRVRWPGPDRRERRSSSIHRESRARAIACGLGATESHTRDPRASCVGDIPQLQTRSVLGRYRREKHERLEFQNLLQQRSPSAGSVLTDVPVGHEECEVLDRYVGVASHKGMHMASVSNRFPRSTYISLTPYEMQPFR